MAEIIGSLNQLRSLKEDIRSKEATLEERERALDSQRTDLINEVGEEIIDGLKKIESQRNSYARQNDRSSSQLGTESRSFLQPDSVSARAFDRDQIRIKVHETLETSKEDLESDEDLDIRRSGSYPDRFFPKRGIQSQGTVGYATQRNKDFK